MIAGAGRSIGSLRSAAIGPLPSSGRPSGSTTRPSRPGPTGTRTTSPVPRTMSPASTPSTSSSSTQPIRSRSSTWAKPNWPPLEPQQFVEPDIGQAGDQRDAVADLLDPADLLRPAAPSVAAPSCVRALCSQASARTSASAAMGEVRPDVGEIGPPAVARRADAGRAARARRSAPDRSVNAIRGCAAERLARSGRRARPARRRSSGVALTASSAASASPRPRRVVSGSARTLAAASRGRRRCTAGPVQPRGQAAGDVDRELARRARPRPCRPPAASRRDRRPSRPPRSAGAASAAASACSAAFGLRRPPRALRPGSSSRSSAKPARVCCDLGQRRVGRLAPVASASARVCSRRGRGAARSSPRPGARRTAAAARPGRRR